MSLIALCSYNTKSWKPTSMILGLKFGSNGAKWRAYVLGLLWVIMLQQLLVMNASLMQPIEDISLGVLPLILEFESHIQRWILDLHEKNCTKYVLGYPSQCKQVVREDN